MYITEHEYRGIQTSQSKYLSLRTSSLCYLHSTRMTRKFWLLCITIDNPSALNYATRGHQVISAAMLTRWQFSLCMIMQWFVVVWYSWSINPYHWQWDNYAIGTINNVHYFWWSNQEPSICSPGRVQIHPTNNAILSKITNWKVN